MPSRHGAERAGARFCGIDLAGSERGNTGFCAIFGRRMRTKVLHADGEIIAELKKERPGIVGIDAPLSLPPGRKRISDRKGAHFRKCDLELRKMGIRFFPITLGPMRMLTERGIRIAERIRRMGMRCEEVYPGAAYDVFGVPRKDKGAIRKWLGRSDSFWREGKRRMSWTRAQRRPWCGCWSAGRQPSSAGRKGLQFPQE